jgi:hypothetical protein
MYKLCLALLLLFNLISCTALSARENVADPYIFNATCCTLIYMKERDKPLAGTVFASTKEKTGE